MNVFITPMPNSNWIHIILWNQQVAGSCFCILTNLTWIEIMKKKIAGCWWKVTFISTKLKPSQHQLMGQLFLHFIYSFGKSQRRKWLSSLHPVASWRHTKEHESLTSHHISEMYTFTGLILGWFLAGISVKIAKSLSNIKNKDFTYHVSTGEN